MCLYPKGYINRIKRDIEHDLDVDLHPSPLWRGGLGGVQSVGTSEIIPKAKALRPTEIISKKGCRELPRL